jgi:hypothetical protein
MYAVTAETPQPGQARHAHLSSYCGNLDNVYACVSKFRSGACSYSENPHSVCVCVCVCV